LCEWLVSLFTDWRLQAKEGHLGYSNKARHQFLPIPMLSTAPKEDTEKVSSIVAGDNHLLALSTHGVMYTWGVSKEGQLGRRIVARHRINGTTVTIGAGAFTSFAVDEEGVLWGWWLNNLRQMGTGSDDVEVGTPARVVGMSREELGGGCVVVAVVGGEHHSVFVVPDGSVYACERAN
jgi:regulator of chromosome condensation